MRKSEAMLRLLCRGTHRQKCGLSRVCFQQSPSASGPFTHYHFHQQRRRFAELSTVLLPPVVFSGLLIALLVYKSFMMVIFQNKIIYVSREASEVRITSYPTYMPGLPPNSRREKIADYKNQCGGVVWHEESTKSMDGTRISLCVASVDGRSEVSQSPNQVYILYFQGNASSLPPRLPFLSPVLGLLKDRQAAHPVRYTMVCCSYRGYWTSKGRPSEQGIAKDAAAALKWINSYHDPHAVNSLDRKIPVVIWGQSIGGGVAANLAAQQELFAHRLILKSLILETPFISIRAMLETLYPQKWLPYRYLWPFLRNHLDSSKALESMKENAMRSGLKPPSILILEAGRDELVPKSHGDILEKKCVDLGLEVRKKVVGSALHTEAMVRPEGRLAVVEAIEAVSSQPCLGNQ